MFTTPGGTIWVCTDCMILAANGEEPLDRPDSEPEPWALWPDSAGETTMGLLREQHECDYATGGEYGDCDCERREFSWSDCDGCGSRLGGARYAYTYWTDGPEPDRPSTHPTTQCARIET